MAQSVDELVGRVALAYGLQIDPRSLPKVAEFYTRILSLSALLAEFPLPTPIDTPPVFRE